MTLLPDAGCKYAQTGFYPITLAQIAKIKSWTMFTTTATSNNGAGPSAGPGDACARDISADKSDIERNIEASKVMIAALPRAVELLCSSSAAPVLDGQAATQDAGILMPPWAFMPLSALRNMERKKTCALSRVSVTDTNARKVVKLLEAFTLDRQVDDALARRDGGMTLMHELDQHLELAAAPEGGDELILEGVEPLASMFSR